MLFAEITNSPLLDFMLIVAFMGYGFSVMAKKLKGSTAGDAIQRGVIKSILRILK